MSPPTNQNNNVNKHTISAEKKKKISREMLEEAIPESYGIVSVVAQRLDVHWNTARNALDRYPDLKQFFETEKEIILDVGENALIKAVKSGEGWAIKYLLSTQGKHRGYTEKPDTSQVPQTPTIQFDFTKLNPDELKQIEHILKRLTPVTDRTA